LFHVFALVNHCATATDVCAFLEHFSSSIPIDIATSSVNFSQIESTKHLEPHKEAAKEETAQPLYLEQCGSQRAASKKGWSI
jgi:hypothetical protein